MALVKYAMEMKVVLQERDRSNLQLRNAINKLENYEILANFPFSSETKKMSVLVRNKETNRYIYYVKGAEVVMELKVKPAARANVLEFCESLAMDGLRTLVIAQKVLTQEAAQAFLAKYHEAAQKLKHRDYHVQACVAEFEKDLEFLGVTGVEDKLQNNV
mmetsp:Transcript_9353/g.7123  ORF Transcript_9353/g.7123 Transcript_9353/m.7123 type:complete len:160 (-) Transcript_9353:1213-1692(-)|eukprot:CAMPEP_0202961468 /NCGR_PEP_ID=MMETSP1396-20130829/5520_1 /ASSEMBLY_ACC=CAM_ASM_000872 /TAXON_ID= /ORGANISM="Pseudokeronopsis sp., Strain Brazil" /LENGTH=159 /DNA_ID=CAMNT_0049681303 /DNA_START=138 /DNA_END=617 /DNA_ORIENTATION=-